MTGTPAVERAVRKPAPSAARPAGTRAARWCAAVAAAFTLVQLMVVLPGSGLGWDETVYVSQFGTGAEPAYFSAPRARGITLLVAPVTSLTSSVPVLRGYLAVLSGLALFGALMVWRRLLPPAVVTLAGALFASLWITLFYGPQAMPNLWVALGSLCAVGFFLHAVPDGGAAGGGGADRRAADGRSTTSGGAAGGRATVGGAADGAPVTVRGGPAGNAPPRGAALFGLAAAMAFVALMRPSDALWLGLPLLLAASCVRRWRRPDLLAALLVGTAAGWAPWVVEAYTAYGGLAERLHRASEIQGRLGPHLAFDDQLKTLDGRTLCRPCDGPWRHPVTALWWFALPVLTALGVLAALRGRTAAARPGRFTATLPDRPTATLPDRPTAALRGRTTAALRGRTASAPQGRTAAPHAPSPPAPASRTSAAPSAAATAHGLLAPRVLLPTLVGLSLAVPYLLLIGYAAARFLLPAYALLALPAALGTAWLVVAVRPRARLLVAAVLAVLLAGHLAVQYAVLSSAAARLRESGAAFGAAAAELRRYGVRPPCVISGQEAVRLAHRTGCVARQTAGHDRSTTGPRLAERARAQPVAVVVHSGARAPEYARHWRVRPLSPLPGVGDLRVHLSPSARTATTSTSTSTR